MNERNFNEIADKISALLNGIKGMFSDYYSVGDRDYVGESGEIEVWVYPYNGEDYKSYISVCDDGIYVDFLGENYKTFDEFAKDL